MDRLLFIWFSALALAAAAVIWMTWLIVARLLRERAEARRTRNRAVIHQAFLDIMAGSGEAVGRLTRVRGRARTMAEALLEVMGLVRGAERERLVAALAAFQVDEVFRRRLFRGSAAGRIAAAEALAAFPGDETRTALQRALVRARDGELRAGLMRSLIEIGAPPELDQVLAGIGRAPTADSLLYLPLIARLVADNPRAGLRAFGDPEVAGEARAILAEALGSSGDYRVLEPLAAAARAPDVELRIAAIRGLSALGHPAAEPTIRAGLTDPFWVVRAASCEAAGRIGLRSTAPELAAQLQDPVWWVRFRAGEALAALGEAGRTRLHAIAAAGDDLSRRTAAIVLAERGLAPEPA